MKSVASKRDSDVYQRVMEFKTNIGITTERTGFQWISRFESNEDLMVPSKNPTFLTTTFRGEELADLLTRLGPTFIKVGQSLSIRSDLLSESYVKGLTTLQDKVPPFSSSEAFKIMEVELGQSVDSLFSSITAEPIASASLGQVYKATVKTTGQEVAVKIQRPRSVEKIALVSKR